MAMINCPECGQVISDKAKKCIHCGKVFVEEGIVKDKIKCNECGTILLPTDEICSNCGCPVENKITEKEIKIQQVDVATINMQKKTKRIIQGVIIALIICVAGGVGYKLYSDSKAQKEYQESYNTYIYDLEKAQFLMISGGSDAESLCNLTLQVWGNAIYENSDEETDKYTRPNGYFVSDFNTALENLYANSDTQDTISYIQSNQASVKEVIKKLQNPPEGLNKCYDTVTVLYEAYKTLTDLAINPTGSYNSVSTDKNDTVSDFLSAYDKLDNQIPEKIRTE